MDEQNQENQKDLEMELKRCKKEINFVQQKNQEYISLVQHLKERLKEKENIKENEEKHLTTEHTGKTDQGDDIKLMEEQIKQVHHEIRALKETVEKIYEQVKNDGDRILTNQSPDKKDNNSVTFRDFQNAVDVKVGNKQGLQKSDSSHHKSFPSQHINCFPEMKSPYWESNETLENIELESKEKKTDYSISEEVEIPEKDQNKRGNRLFSLLKWKS